MASNKQQPSAELPNIRVRAYACQFDYLAAFHNISMCASHMGIDFLEYLIYPNPHREFLMHPLGVPPGENVISPARAYEIVSSRLTRSLNAVPAIGMVFWNKHKDHDHFSFLIHVKNPTRCREGLPRHFYDVMYLNPADPFPQRIMNVEVPSVVSTYLNFLGTACQWRYRLTERHLNLPCFHREASMHCVRVIMNFVREIQPYADLERLRNEWPNIPIPGLTEQAAISSPPAIVPTRPDRRSERPGPTHIRFADTDTEDNLQRNPDLAPNNPSFNRPPARKAARERSDQVCPAPQPSPGILDRGNVQSPSPWATIPQNRPNFGPYIERPTVPPRPPRKLRGTGVVPTAPPAAIHPLFHESMLRTQGQNYQSPNKYDSSGPSSFGTQPNRPEVHFHSPGVTSSLIEHGTPRPINVDNFGYQSSDVLEKRSGARQLNRARAQSASPNIMTSPMDLSNFSHSSANSPEAMMSSMGLPDVTMPAPRPNIRGPDMQTSSYGSGAETSPYFPPDHPEAWLYQFKRQVQEHLRPQPTPRRSSRTTPSLWRRNPVSAPIRPTEYPPEIRRHPSMIPPPAFTPSTVANSPNSGVERQIDPQPVTYAMVARGRRPPLSRQQSLPTIPPFLARVSERDFNANSTDDGIALAEYVRAQSPNRGAFRKPDNISAMLPRQDNSTLLSVAKAWLGF